MFDDAVRDVSLFSDASGSFGCGAWWVHHWFQFEWPGSWKGRNITLPVVLACAVWGPQWRGRMAVAHVDNKGAVAVLNSGCSKKGQIMHLMRSLFFIMAHYQILLSACHVPGAQNGIADAISWNNLSLFFSLLQAADLTPTSLLELLVALLVTEQPDWTSTAWSQSFRSCFQRVWQRLPGEHTQLAKIIMPIFVIITLFHVTLPRMRNRLSLSHFCLSKGYQMARLRCTFQPFVMPRLGWVWAIRGFWICHTSNMWLRVL